RAEQAGTRGRVDDPGRAGTPGLRLRAPILGGVAKRGEMPLEVHVDDVVPVVLTHPDEHPVAQESRVVHQDVESTERVDRLLDELTGPLPRGDVVAVDHGVATGGLDLRDDLLGRRLTHVRSVETGTEVVDHDL